MANTVENIGVIYAQQVDWRFFFGMSLTKNDNIQKAILDMFGRVSPSKSPLSATFLVSSILSSSLLTCIQNETLFPPPVPPATISERLFPGVGSKAESTEVKLLKRESQCKVNSKEEETSSAKTSLSEALRLKSTYLGNHNACRKECLLNHRHPPLSSFPAYVFPLSIHAARILMPLKR